MVTTAHTKRLFGALLAFAMFIGLSVTGSVVFADDNTSGGSANLNGCSTTVVVDTSIKLSGDITLNKGCSIERAKGFTGPIFTVKDSTVTITGNGATIDGKGVSADAPLVTVTEAKLTVNNVTLKGGVNNKTQVVGDAMTDESWNSKGGAIGARKSTVNLNGVTISNNTAALGGGLFADGSIVNVNSGTKFNNNEALYAKAASFVAHKYAAGAGIFVVTVHGNSTVNVVAGASFVDNGNTNLSAGGAIATGRIVKKQDGQHGLEHANATYTMNATGKTTLNIKGGDFKGNKAGLAGGAIFVQRSDVAVVTGGNFDGNHADGHSLVQNFSGGAIYVEGPGKGYGHDWEVGSVGEGLPGGALYLKNALITDNTAGQAGGGIALCDTGDGFVGYTDGAAIYGNTARKNKEGNDIHISRAGGAPSTTTLSRKALGGANNQWVGKDGAGNDIDPYYVAPGGHKYRWFTNQLTADKVPDSVVKVRFTKNSTNMWGGAIGVNGDLIIGEQVGAFYIKKVDSVTKNPLGGAEFQLTGPNGYDVKLTTQASGANAGEAAFHDLLPGEYKLVETKAPEGYPDLKLEWKVVIANAADNYAVTISDADGNKVTPAETRDDSAGNAYGVYKLENTPGVTKGEEIAIRTTATDNADGDKTVDAGKVKVKDVVAYENLMPGTEYTVKGKLVVKGTDGKNVVAEAQAKFTPTAKNGKVEVIFSADTTKLAGKELVAYEYLFEGDVTGENIDLTKAEEDARFLTKHADDNDAAQTVKVKPTLPLTGLAKTGAAVGIILFAGALVFAGMILLRRRQA